MLAGTPRGLCYWFWFWFFFWFFFCSNYDVRASNKTLTPHAAVAFIVFSHPLLLFFLLLTPPVLDSVLRPFARLCFLKPDVARVYPPAAGEEYCGYSPSEQEEQHCSPRVRSRAFALCGLGGQPALLCDVLSSSRTLLRDVSTKSEVRVSGKRRRETQQKHSREAFLFLFLYSCHMRIRIVSSCLCEYWSCSFIYLFFFYGPIQSPTNPSFRPFRYFSCVPF